MNDAAIIALLACVISAALEGIFAGWGVKEYMASLRMPRFAPPMRAWYIIGALYYIACFVVIYRLFSLPASLAPRPAGLVLVFTVMAMNAAWNYVFFRARSVLGSLLVSLPYSLAAVALFACLLRLDRAAAAAFSPYLLYLIFANYWGYALWQLNR